MQSNISKFHCKVCENDFIKVRRSRSCVRAVDPSAPEIISRNNNAPCIARYQPDVFSKHFSDARKSYHKVRHGSTNTEYFHRKSKRSLLEWVQQSPVSKLDVAVWHRRLWTSTNTNIWYCICLQNGQPIVTCPIVFTWPTVCPWSTM